MQSAPASLERDKAYQADGHATMYGMLRSALGWSERECRVHMQIARLVDAEPSAGDAVVRSVGSGCQHRHDRPTSGQVSMP